MTELRFIRDTEATMSFEFSAAAMDALGLHADEVRRSLTVEHEYHWTRWQRLVNAFLRVMLWPLGPDRLPKSYSVTVPGLRITSIEETDEGLSVEMSTR